MQAANLAFVIDQATDERHDEPFALAVRGAIEVGVVVPSILRARLAAARFTVTEDEAALADYGFRSTQHLRRTVVADASGVIVAMGAAGDHDEAVLHAALGWFREHPLPEADVPAGLATLPGEG
ncbi:MAG: hypothetical protein AB1627_01025 [Chloroflexota bacterium]